MGTGTYGKGGEARTTEKAWATFERSLEVVLGFLTKNVNLDRLGFVQRLDSHDGLHEERLGIFEVYMEEGHHRNGGEDTLNLWHCVGVRRGKCSIGHDTKRDTHEL